MSHGSPIAVMTPPCIEELPLKKGIFLDYSDLQYHIESTPKDREYSRHCLQLKDKIVEYFKEVKGIDVGAAVEKDGIRIFTDLEWSAYELRRMFIGLRKISSSSANIRKVDTKEFDSDQQRIHTDRVVLMGHINVATARELKKHKKLKLF